MSEDVTHQLNNDCNNCACFSLQLDESTDIRDAAQVIVFIRMVFYDWSIKEEVLGIITLKERTRGIHIFNAFKIYCFEINLPLWKLMSVTTDRARSMVGSVNDFIALCEKDDDFPYFLKYHCITHQQALCSKRLNTKELMDIAFKTVNSVRAKSLRRRLFRQEFKGQELLLHTDVRWLSSGKFLQRFQDLLQEIKVFLQNIGDNYAMVNDLVWMSDLAFLADFTGRLSASNLQLQGKSKLLIELISTTGAFKMQIPALIANLEKWFEFFPNIKDHLQNHLDSIWNPEKYVAEVNMVSDDFKVRLRDFQKIEEIVKYVSYPFKSDLQSSIFIGKRCNWNGNVDIKSWRVFKGSGMRKWFWESCWNKILQYQKMCRIHPFLFWFNVFMWICIFIYECNRNKTTCHANRLPLGRLPKVVFHRIHTWVWKDGEQYDDSNISLIHLMK